VNFISFTSGRLTIRLDPGGREGYNFKDSLLDRACQHVTAAASSYLAWALAELKKMIDVKLDAGSVKTLGSSNRLICRTLFKKLFYEAGHSPLNPSPQRPAGLVLLHLIVIEN
jgi:hypothetical protein